MQYPWGYALPVSHIISTRESYPQYPWVISSVPVRVCSTCEDMQYLWGKFHSFFIHINLLTGTAYPHGYWGYDSRVLMTWLTGTAHLHGYLGYDSWVLRIWLTGTAYPHGYWGYDSWVLMIWLMGTAYLHGYLGYDSWVLMIWLMGTAYPHGYWGYHSRVLMIWLTGNAYSLYRVKHRETKNLSHKKINKCAKPWSFFLKYLKFLEFFSRKLES